MNLKGRNKISPQFNMASMTDIVFLLLLFFMLTSTLVNTNALDLLLPKGEGKSRLNEPVSVSITKDEVYYINTDKIELDFIENKLTELLQGQENPTVSVRAEQGVKIENVVSVLDILSRNQIKAVLAVDAE